MIVNDNFSPLSSSFDLHRRASIERNLVIRGLHAATRASTQWLRRLVLRITRLALSIAAESRRRSVARFRFSRFGLRRQRARVSRRLERLRQQARALPPRSVSPPTSGS